jgi:lipoprotein-anchoring transpeptidase ErfK/SrfK
VSRQFSAPNSIPQAAKTQASISRRTVLTGLGAMGLAGISSCASTLDMPDLGLDQMSTGAIRPNISIDKSVTSSEVMYASFADSGFQLPEIPYQKVDSRFRRQIVIDPTGEAPGTIVVHLQERFLYLVQPGGDAIRYGVGIGRDGFRWSGRANIQYGKKWPVWTPPSEMIQRKPELEKWRGGQPGGLDNPLGARALYIYKDGQDTGYRIHGSPEWWTIGQAMSSGCVRMINQDVIDLYNRISAKAPIVVA